MSYVEERVAEIDELRDGELRQVSVKRFKVLLARYQGTYYALEATCPHAGAPLSEALVQGSRLICPWHAASFEITSGQVLAPPSLEGLRRYEVRVEDRDVIVRVPKRPESIALPENLGAVGQDRDDRCFVVVGGGAAGDATLESLRQHGFGGRLMLIAGESRAPYDRTQCSKAYLAGQASAKLITLRPPGYYDALNVEVHSGRAQQIDATSRSITLEDGTQLVPDKLVIATGGSAKRLPIDGSQLGGVLTLRSAEDADRLREQAETARQVVLIGGGFIGLEVAATLAERDDPPRITVICPEPIPLQDKVGPVLGGMLQREHEKHGVNFVLDRKVITICGTDRAEGVILDDGSTHQADLVVMAVGIEPNTAMITGLDLADDGAIEVDDQLRVNGRDDLLAIGDLARYPNPQRPGERIRVEHWRVAQQHGQWAGAVMAGQPRAFQEPAYFWTKQYDLSLKAVGHPDPDRDQTLVIGDPAEGPVTVYFHRDGTIQAAAGTDADRLHLLLEQMRTGQVPPLDEISDIATARLSPQSLV